MIQERYNKLVLPIFFIVDLLIFNFYYALFSFDSKIDFPIFAILNISWVVFSLFYKSYAVPRVVSIRLALKSIFYTWSSVIFLYLLINFTIFQITDFLNISISFIVFSGFTILLFSFIRYRFFLNYRKKGKNYRVAILIGKFKRAKFDLIRNEGMLFGYNFIKHLKNYKKYIEELDSIISHKKINIIFLNESEKDIIDEISYYCDDNGIRLKLLLDIPSSAGHRAGLDIIGGYPMMDVRHEPLLYLGNKIIKRFVDIFFGILSIVFILSWLPVVVKIVQSITYPGPLFFVQDRVGFNGKTFKLYKFRTMRITEEVLKAQRGESEKTKKFDSRIPWFGKLLRSSNLDECPQFINVFLGNMSTVGPRPYMIGEDKFLERHIPRYKIRRFVKPGVTGWAAINGYRGGTDSINHMSKRTNLDIWYLENWTIWLDIKIIFKTFWQMITLRIPKAY